LLADGFVAEVSEEDVLNPGEGIEPQDEGAPGVTLFEAVVEFIAKDAGKTGDFSGAGHGGGVE
jgi:hypothetical protein